MPALDGGQGKELILPLNSFRQCLQVVGVRVSQAQLSKFVVRGQLSGYEQGERSPLGGRTPPQRRTEERANGSR